MARELKISCKDFYPHENYIYICTSHNKKPSSVFSSFICFFLLPRESLSGIEPVKLVSEIISTNINTFCMTAFVIELNKIEILVDVFHF